MILEFSEWMKSTIPGIVILGTIGSLSALFILRLLQWAFHAGRRPFHWHMNQKVKQAYFQGYASAIIENDKTDRMLISYVAYRFSRLMLLIFFCVFCLCLFMGSIFTIANEHAAYASAFFLSMSLLFLYLTLFEFDYIYQIYRYFWSDLMKHAENKYRSKSEKRPDITDSKNK